MTDNIKNNEQAARHVLAKLIAHLTKNSTLSNMSSIGPKADDFNCFIGRGEDIQSIVAKLAGIDYHALKDMINEHLNSDVLLIDSHYLNALLNDCDNPKLVEAVAREAGINFVPEKKAVIELKFEATDDQEDEFIAKTPFYNYEIWKYPNGYRANAMISTRTHERLGGRKLTWDEAVAKCNEHYFSRLKQCNGG